jgi:hypothetical protein
VFTCMYLSCPCDDFMDDNVWNDALDDGLEREGKARETKFFNSGFREGVNEGRTQQVQDGFNAGFAAGCPQGERLGRLQGTLETLRILSGQVAGTSAASQVRYSVNVPWTAGMQLARAGLYVIIILLDSVAHVDPCPP